MTKTKIRDVIQHLVKDDSYPLRDNGFESYTIPVGQLWEWNKSRIAEFQHVQLPDIDQYFLMVLEGDDVYRLDFDTELTIECFQLIPIQLPQE